MSRSRIFRRILATVAFVLFGVAAFGAVLAPRFFTERIGTSERLPDVQVFARYPESIHLFADIVPVFVTLKLQKEMVREDTIMFAGHPKPYEVVALPELVSRTETGGIVTRTYQILIRCVSCLPAIQRQYTMDSITVHFEKAAGTRGALSIIFPPFQVVSRLTPEVLDAPYFRLSNPSDTIHSQMQGSRAAAALFLLGLSLLAILLFALYKSVADRLFPRSAVESAQPVLDHRPEELAILEDFPATLTALDDAEVRRRIAGLALWLQEPDMSAVFVRSVAGEVDAFEEMAFAASPLDREEIEALCRTLRSVLRITDNEDLDESEGQGSA